MRYFDTEENKLAVVDQINDRGSQHLENVSHAAASIIADVRARGDDAVADYTRRFDWPKATSDALKVPENQLRDAQFALPRDLSKAMSKASRNIRDYHNAERGHLQTWSHMGPEGLSLGQIIQPVASVGIYVPGGRAAYPSSVLMCVIPAVVAGVKTIVICTPPKADGEIASLVAAAAAEQNVTDVYRIGGAQAIAALAYGTRSVPRVDLIVGPGNAYVNAAKRLVNGDVGIDMLAGPSEIAIIADSGANPAFVAADILAQTEHGPDNRGTVLSPSADLLASVRHEIERQSANLSRQEILAQSGKNLMLIKTFDLDEALSLSNLLAPEHLELQVREPLSLLGGVRNAGAVLLGDYTSAPIGDYFAGPSHTLPTAGAARFSSPLSVATFLKRTSVLHYSREAAAGSADDIARIAMSEGFDGHAAAAVLRKN